MYLSWRAELGWCVDGVDAVLIGVKGCCCFRYCVVVSRRALGLNVIWISSMDMFLVSRKKEKQDYQADGHKTCVRKKDCRDSHVG